MANSPAVAIAVKHPDYMRWETEWSKCRDCFDGQSAVKRRGELYLPKLAGQVNADYNAYKNRALFYSITSKSVSSLVGMVTMKLPKIKHPKNLDYIFQDTSGVQFYETLTKGLMENILMSRYGMLVDRPTGGKANVYIYTAENIINWESDENDNLTMVVLRESILKRNTTNRFELKCEDQYRVLELVYVGGQPTYVQTVYSATGETSGPITVRNTGLSMSFIPFVIVNSFGVSNTIVKPTMLDVCDINLSHYRTSADLENGRHYVGIPTPIVTGGESTTPLKVGGTSAWVIPNKDAKAFYLEFRGEGLKSLENAMKEKEAQLASMSARMTSSGNGSEAAETVRLRYMSETASLSSIARAVEAGINIAYNYVAFMEGLDTNSVSITLDKEFLSTRMSATDVLKLTDSYLKGGMSVETYVHNLRRGDQLSNDRTDAEEIASILAAKPEVVEPTSTPTITQPT